MDIKKQIADIRNALQAPKAMADQQLDQILDDEKPKCCPLCVVEDANEGLATALQKLSDLESYLEDKL